MIITMNSAQSKQMLVPVILRVKKLEEITQDETTKIEIKEEPIFIPNEEPESVEEKKQENPVQPKIKINQTKNSTGNIGRSSLDAPFKNKAIINTLDRRRYVFKPMPKIIVPEKSKEERQEEIYKNILAELRKINQRLDHVETILSSYTPLLNKRITKPSILPMTTREEVLEFNNIDNETYKSCVRYLGSLGGITIREVANLCVKEIFSGDCINHFTWMGKISGALRVFMPLNDTKIARAIFETMCLNRHFTAPSKEEYEKIMKAVIISKRWTNRQNGRKRRIQEYGEVDC